MSGGRSFSPNSFTTTRSQGIGWLEVETLYLTHLLPPTAKELDVEMVYKEVTARPGNAQRGGKARGNGVRINRNTRK